MAISPVGDIVQEVARAADPSLVRQAANGLVSGKALMSANGVGGAVSDPLGDAVSIVRAQGFDAYHVRTTLKTDTAHISAVPSSPYQKLEAMLLQTFVEAMLPKDTDSVFGKGLGGSIWKSMMSEQIASHVAKGGGVGLAKTLENAVKSPVISKI